MTAACQALPRSVAEEMLQVVARAICDRPSETPAQRESRARQMVHCTLGFEPRDGLEYMLASMTVGHFHLILDSMRDVFQGQMDSMKARTKTTIVALDRSLLAFVREARLARVRPLEAAAAAPEAAVPDLAAKAAPAGEAACAPAPPHPATPHRAEARPEPREKSPPDRRIPRDDDTTAQHVAAFHDALVSMAANLAEARSLDDPASPSRSAAGD
jgi:hypothetical protein